VNQNRLCKPAGRAPAHNRARNWRRLNRRPKGRIGFGGLSNGEVVHVRFRLRGSESAWALRRVGTREWGGIVSGERPRLMVVPANLTFASWRRGHRGANL